MKRSDAAMTTNSTGNAEQDAEAFSSMTLGERMVLAARIAVRAHLDQLATQDAGGNEDRRRNRQQAKRATTEQSFGFGGAPGGSIAPAWIRVTEDPALAPLTLRPSTDDQAEPLRELVRRASGLRIGDPDNDRDRGGAAA